MRELSFDMRHETPGHKVKVGWGKWWQGEMRYPHCIKAYPVGSKVRIYDVCMKKLLGEVRSKRRDIHVIRIQVQDT